MSINNIGFELYELVCDDCGESEETDSFQEAVKLKKEDGWVSRKEDGEWVDLCPSCGGK